MARASLTRAMVYFQRGSLSGETSGEQAGDFKFDREIRSSATPFTEMGQANLLEVLPEDTDSVLKDSTYHHEKHLQLPSDRGLYDGIIQRHDWPLVCPPYTGPAGRFSWQSSLGLHHGESPTTPSDSQSYIPTSIPVMGDLLSASSVYQQSRHPFLLQNHDLLVQPPKNLWVEDARSLSDSASPTPYSPRPYSESLDINIDLEELGEHTSSSEEVMVQEKLGDVPYAQLIYSALMEAPGNRMVLRDIYHWIERNTDKANNPEFTGWQNSVRHNLSMNKVRFTWSSKNYPLNFSGFQEGRIHLCQSQTRIYLGFGGFCSWKRYQAHYQVSKKRLQQEDSEEARS